MSDLPYMYGYENIIYSSFTPSSTHPATNATSQYFRRYLLQKAMSVYKWVIPETWDLNYFLYTIYCVGYSGIFRSPKYGVINQYVGLKGYNIFYQPRQFIAANPYFDEQIERDVGRDGVIIKLQSNYLGVIDKIAYYADKLAALSETIDTNLTNSKLAYVFVAGNKAGAESFKKLFDRIQQGEPAVVIDKNLMTETGDKAWYEFANNLGANYLVTDLLADYRQIENQFCTDFGLPNANTQKRERLITDEVNANNTETYSLAAMWLDNLKEGCKQARDMFGIDLDVDWRQDPTETSEPAEAEEGDNGNTF